MLLRGVGVALAVTVAMVDSTSASDVVDLAASQIGKPYVWGAEGPTAFDCSGLTHYVFRKFDIELPRRAISQSRTGTPVRGLRRGDLLFFSSDTRRRTVTHVGIYEGGGQMIDASQRYGRVRRSRLEDEYWVERFMFARRMRGDTPGALPPNRRPRQPHDSGPVPVNAKEQLRRAAARAAGELAGILLRRSP
jgi:cell wall-associated NlpC family hydrolase